MLGGESGGVSESVGRLVERWLAIPMARGVESLNVASAAAVVSFEIARQRKCWSPQASANYGRRR